MKTYKLSVDSSTGNTHKYLIEMIDGTPTGVLVHSELNQEYLKWLEEGNTPEPADE